MNSSILVRIDSRSILKRSFFFYDQTRFNYNCFTFSLLILSFYDLFAKAFIFFTKLSFSAIVESYLCCHYFVLSYNSFEYSSYLINLECVSISFTFRYSTSVYAESGTYELPYANEQSFFKYDITNIYRFIIKYTQVLKSYINHQSVLVKLRQFAVR